MITALKSQGAALIAAANSCSALTCLTKVACYYVTYGWNPDPMITETGSGSISARIPYSDSFFVGARLPTVLASL